MTTDYAKQAGDFLKTHGIKLSIVVYPDDLQSAPKWCAPGEKHGLRYRVTLRQPGKQLSFDFWDSIHNREELEKVADMSHSPERLRIQRKHTPSAYDVLACISSDSHCEDTFRDWCADSGYDRDSRKALSTYKRCKRFSKRIQAFFTPEQLEQLQEIN